MLKRQMAIVDLDGVTMKMRYEQMLREGDGVALTFRLVSLREAPSESPERVLLLGLHSQR